jgi:hypothetical protein
VHMQPTSDRAFDLDLVDGQWPNLSTGTCTVKYNSVEDKGTRVDHFLSPKAVVSWHFVKLSPRCSTMRSCQRRTESVPRTL